LGEQLICNRRLLFWDREDGRYGTEKIGFCSAR
jgi:hypothetical protein